MNNKRTLLVLTVLTIVAGTGFAIGFHLGKQTKYPKITSGKEMQGSQDLGVTERLVTLSDELSRQKLNQKRLNEELTEKNTEIKRLKQVLGTTTSPAPEPERVLPVTTYERKSFVTNLVHQFNADNASTDIVDVDCKDDHCFLTANVSAGSKTNPEISNLMKFMDDKQLPSFYQQVKLLSVTKKDKYSEIVLSLDL
ncbi:hypothetical protein [Kangiella sediminilitoris]|uniref:Uncharacterized protein n=1 Tax=Kangiella sediminilitoris TaxID=1144748 RepID=A0A1B3B8F1_9GAMM|nr:hypothetical protein [Kangiella sediminilitoris]AOE49079.1 hypothetical protein KS2013_354 [Kangiella sediminilitoris]